MTEPKPQEGTGNFSNFAPLDVLAEFETHFCPTPDRAEYVRYRLEELEELEVKRDEFAEFTANQGITPINTTRELIQRAIEVDQSMKSMRPEERFTTLMTWRTHADVAGSLIRKANEFIGLSCALNLPQFGDKSPSELSVEELNEVEKLKYSEGEGHELPDPYLQPSPYWQSFSLRGDVPLPFPVRDTGTPEYINEAAEFACYEDAVKTCLLYRVLAATTAEMVGIDTVTDMPVILDKQVKSLKEAQAQTRPLPEGLKRWYERGLGRNSYTPDNVHFYFYRSCRGMRRVVSIMLPEGPADPLFIQYKKAVDAFNPEDGEADIDWGNRAQARDNVELALGELQELIFQELETTFGEATASLHPELEHPARYLAVYALTSGEGYRMYRGYRVIDEVKDKPLSAMIPSLRKVAYAEGSYLAPLKAEIAAKAKEFQMEPGQLAIVLEEALRVRDSRESNPLLNVPIRDEENWFITEALFTPSTVDNQGRYLSTGGDGSPRSAVVVRKLIDYIRTLGNN